MRTTTRCFGVIAAAAALVVGVIAAGGVAASAAPGGGECTLGGTANFDGAGLAVTSSNFTYSFSGSLSGCHSSTSAPASGTVAAGKAYTVTVPYSVAGVGYSATYGLPQATGSGGCAQSSTAGTAVATWADGSSTVIGYTTTGAAVAVELQGTVVPSVTLVLLSSTGPTPPAPPTVTSGSDFATGDGALGQLVFSTTNPTGCQTGLSTASINGVVGIGSES